MPEGIDGGIGRLLERIDDCAMMYNTDTEHRKRECLEIEFE